MQLVLEGDVAIRAYLDGAQAAIGASVARDATEVGLDGRLAIRVHRVELAARLDGGAGDGPARRFNHPHLHDVVAARFSKNS